MTLYLLFKVIAKPYVKVKKSLTSWWSVRHWAVDFFDSCWSSRCTPGRFTSMCWYPCPNHRCKCSSGVCCVPASHPCDRLYHCEKRSIQFTMPWSKQRFSGSKPWFQFSP